MTGAWTQAKGGKGGGRTDAGNGRRHRHTALGAETSVRGWQVAGVGNVQVEGFSFRESRRGECYRERCYYGDQLLVGGR